MQAMSSSMMSARVRHGRVVAGQKQRLLVLATGFTRSAMLRSPTALRVAARPQDGPTVAHDEISSHMPAAPEHPALSELDIKAAERRQQRQREQLTYQASAIAATVGVTGLAVMATYCRLVWHLQGSGQMPWDELAGTLALVAGGVFFMEMYARFAHKVLWHDFEPGWALHKSHHMPRTGPFEDNDIFAVINGVPATALCLYGFLTPGMTGSFCFGAGLGITLFGIMYMFVHDGLVHRRFPVGPIADLPYLKRLAAAHQLHHAHKYDGAPWGMFLALQELDSIPGARDDVERLVGELDLANRK